VAGLSVDSIVARAGEVERRHVREQRRRALNERASAFERVATAQTSDRLQKTAASHVNSRRFSGNRQCNLYDYCCQSSVDQ